MLINKDSELIYCKRCHEAKRMTCSYETAVAELSSITNVAVIDLCTSYCGPGDYLHFVTVDDEIIEAENFESLKKILKG